MFTSPTDIAFSIFGFPVYFYGIILAVAVLVGVYLSYFLHKKYYDTEGADKFLDFSPYLIITGIIGARLYYCMVNYSYYFDNPGEIFNIRQGGLSIHGMILIGILSLYIFAKSNKICFLKLTDSVLCATALSQSIGRWGNFFNSEAFGIPCNLPWKLFIPYTNRPVQYINFAYFHPTFLYESLLDLGIFIILFLLFKSLSEKPGILSCLYLILYSLVRIFVEHFRIDSVLNISGIPIAQVVSIILFTAGFFGVLLLNRNFKK